MHMSRVSRAPVCLLVLVLTGVVAWRPLTARAQSAAAPLDKSAQYTIMPGRGIGALTLGTRMQDVIAILGAPVSTWTFLDGRRVYRWFQPPSNSGVGVGTDATGLVDRIWVLNDPRYRTTAGIHAGATEEQVVRMMGRPTGSVVDAAGHLRKLFYAANGVWFSVQLDQRYAFYNQVFEIGVTAPAESLVRR